MVWIVYFVGRSFGLNRQYVLCALCYTHFRGNWASLAPRLTGLATFTASGRGEEIQSASVAFHSFNAGVARHIYIHYGVWGNSSLWRVLRNAWLKLAILVVLCSCIALQRKFLAFCKDKLRIGVAVAKCVAFDLRFIRFQDISNQLTLVFPRCSATCKEHAVQIESNSPKLSSESSLSMFSWASQARPKALKCAQPSSWHSKIAKQSPWAVKGEFMVMWCNPAEYTLISSAVGKTTRRRKLRYHQN